VFISALFVKKSVLGICGLSAFFAASVFCIESEQKSENRDNLFESRFQIGEQRLKDFAIFDSCPTKQSAKETKTRKFFDNKPDSSQPITKRIHLTADQVPENSDSRTLLEGNVTMTTDTSLLKANKLISDNQKQQIIATGDVSVESKDSLLLAKQFEGDQKTGRSKLSDVKFHFFSNNGNGKADSIVSDENNVTTLNDLTFSTCPTNNESWRFSADELQLDQKDGRGEAWGMWLKVKGIPVFYFPYLNFPIDDQRKSGLLMPAISNSGRNGLDISLPIYWNIAAQADATFKPRSIQNRGTQLGTEFRYLSENSINNLSFELLADDRLAIDLLDIDASLGEGLYGLSKDRWAVSFQNETHFNENWSASINASKVSDRDYFRDLGTGLISPQGTNSQSQLLSQAGFSYQDDIWLVSLLTESTQSLVGDEPYRILPSLISNADYYQASSGLRWQFESDFSYFSHSDQNKIEGKRFNITPSLSYPIQRTYAWLTPKLSYQMTQYQQDNLLTTEQIDVDRDLPIFSLDTGLFFDRSTEWDGKSTTHSLEPRVYYAYIPNREHTEINNFDSRLPNFSFSQLWQANRFAGVDRIGDTNHLSLALTNRFVRNDIGEQVLAFSFGRKIYFEDRLVQLDTSLPVETNRSSPWLAEVSYQANSNLEFSGFIEWDDGNGTGSRDKNTNLARSQIKFEPIQDHIVNLSHRVRNTNGFSNEELDFSFAWPINDEWRLVGRWYNDLQLERTAETLFGFEYDSCCWAVSIVSRRYLDVRLDAFGQPISGNLLAGQENEFDSGIQLQFVFKGLGSPGQKSVSQLLKNSIRGYQSRF